MDKQDTAEGKGSGMLRAEVARMIDHTLLTPEATRADVAELVREAKTLGTYSVCVSPSLLPLNPAELLTRTELLGSTELLKPDPADLLNPAELPNSADPLNSAALLISADLEGLKVACVIGFPSGAHASQIKAAEAADAAGNGADELDMVINLGLAKAGDWAGVEADIRVVRQAAPTVVLKVIVESAALTDGELVAACQAAAAAGADFIKTSTGFHKAGGATVHAVKLMRATVGQRLGVKASGGIRDAQTALAMIEAGANRLGLSGSRAVLSGFPE